MLSSRVVLKRVSRRLNQQARGFTLAALDKPFSTPDLVQVDHPPTQPEVTKLDNGLTVVTMETYQPCTSVGMFIDAGCRYESYETQGQSHFLEKMAFKSTKTHSSYALHRDMTKFGCNAMASSSRETIMFTADVLRKFQEDAVSLIGDIIENPAFHIFEVNSQKALYAQTLDDTKSQDPETQITEAIHAAAFNNNTLGNPLQATKRTLSFIAPQALEEYVQTYFTPQRMVLSASGTEHKQFVEYAEKYLSHMPPGPELEKQKAVYTGGEIKLHDQADPEKMAHLCLAFETANWHSDDLIPMFVLDSMMGGGSSFSAGGPGKGMYSRIYKDVLNKHAWINAAQVFNALYTDSGLFGIYATAANRDLGGLCDVVVHTLKTMVTEPPEEVELARAKNQSKSTVLLNLENRLGICEDLGRQLLVYGKRIPPEEVIARIDAVTAQNIVDVASKMLKTAPSIAVIGDCTQLPLYHQFQDALKF